MKLTKLVIKNWLALQSAELALSSTTAIYGPNGSGKTSGLDALRWVTGGDAPKRLKVEDLVARGTKALDVALELEAAEGVIRTVGRRRTKGEETRTIDGVVLGEKEWRAGLATLLGQPLETVAAVLDGARLLTMSAEDAQRVLFSALRPDFSEKAVLGAVPETLRPAALALVRRGGGFGSCAALEAAGDLAVEARKERKRALAAATGALVERQQAPGGEIPPNVTREQVVEALSKKSRERDAVLVKVGAARASVEHSSAGALAVARSNAEAAAKALVETQATAAGWERVPRPDPATGGEALLAARVEAGVRADKAKLVEEAETKAFEEADQALKAMERPCSHSCKVHKKCQQMPTVLEAEAKIEALNETVNKAIKEMEAADEALLVAQDALKDHLRKGEARAAEYDRRKAADEKAVSVARGRVHEADANLAKVMAEQVAAQEVGAEQVTALEERVARLDGIIARGQSALTSMDALAATEKAEAAEKAAEAALAQAEELATVLGPTGVRAAILESALAPFVTAANAAAAVLFRQALALKPEVKKGGVAWFVAEGDVPGDPLPASGLSRSELLRLGWALSKALVVASGGDLPLLLDDTETVMGKENRQAVFSFLEGCMDEGVQTILCSAKVSDAAEMAKAGPGITAYLIDGGTAARVEEDTERA